MLKKHKKISVIGAGEIGLKLSEILALLNYDVVVYNRYHEEKGKPSEAWLNKMGFVMDLNDSLQLPECGNIRLSHDMQDLQNSKFLIFTAGAKRNSIDETREELALKNIGIIEKFAELIANSPKMRVLIVTNPVDSLTQHLILSTHKNYNIPIEELSKRIFGVSYIDSMRLRNLVKEVLVDKYDNISNSYVEGLALGEHGPSMVPIMSSVKIDGKPLQDFTDLTDRAYINKHTILRGNDIIKLTGRSSVAGPAHATMHMISEMLEKSYCRFPCSVWDGKRCIGRVGFFKDGFLDHIEDTAMTEDERNLLKNSETKLDMQYNNILKLYNK